MAAVLLKMIEPSNGYEAIRRTEGRIKNEAPGKALATVQGVLNFDVSRFADMLEAIENFEMLRDTSQQHHRFGRGLSS